MLFAALQKILGTRPAVPLPQPVVRYERMRPAAMRGHRPAARKPLRVVRHDAGRMVISGRMADVCAELDRLVAMEAQARPQARPQVAQVLAPAR